ncbi:MAG: hypothetical protein JKY13_00490 [Gammaproteobacteria bacterium]|nr:hypothetical protein [Gammaproteobacteria bacterium]
MSSLAQVSDLLQLDTAINNPAIKTIQLTKNIIIYHSKTLLPGQTLTGKYQGTVYALILKYDNTSTLLSSSALRVTQNNTIKNIILNYDNRGNVLFNDRALISNYYDVHCEKNNGCLNVGNLQIEHVKFIGAGIRIEVQDQSQTSHIIIRDNQFKIDTRINFPVLLEARTASTITIDSFQGNQLNIHAATSGAISNMALGVDSHIIYTSNLGGNNKNTRNIINITGNHKKHPFPFVLTAGIYNYSSGNNSSVKFIDSGISYNTISIVNTERNAKIHLSGIKNRVRHGGSILLENGIVNNNIRVRNKFIGNDAYPFPPSGSVSQGISNENFEGKIIIGNAKQALANNTINISGTSGESAVISNQFNKATNSRIVFVGDVINNKMTLAAKNTAAIIHNDAAGFQQNNKIIYRGLIRNNSFQVVQAIIGSNTSRQQPLVINSILNQPISGNAIIFARISKKSIIDNNHFLITGKIIIDDKVDGGKIKYR